jgi:hypothetical protein
MKFFISLESSFFKVGGLDLSRRDLDRDLNLDAKKKSVSTVEIFSTVWKMTSRQFEKWHLDSRDFLDSLDYSKNRDFSIFVEISSPKKVSLDSRDFLDSLKNDISTCRDISISIGLDCRDPQP